MNEKKGKNSGKFEYREEKDRSGFDPVVIAKAEGQVFGAGLSGKYKKNAVTRIGFFVFGVICLAWGLGALLTAFFASKEYGSTIILALEGVILIPASFMIFKNVFSKDHSITEKS